MRLVGSVVAILLTLAACSGKSHDSAPTTPPPTTAATTQASPPTTAGPNPDVIPPVITAAYVNAVFAVLNHVYGDATRTIACVTFSDWRR